MTADATPEWSDTPAAPAPSFHIPPALRWRNELLWLGPLALLSSLLFVRYVRDADFWWHLAAGRWIVENGAIPRTDPFSFTAGGQPWHYVSWPAEWLMFRVWDLGGVEGIVALRLFCVGLVLIGLGLTARESGARRDVVAALLVATAVVIQPRYTLDRPMLPGAVLLVGCLWVCARWWTRGGWSVLWIASLTALWLPTHGAGIVGVICGVGTALSAALFRRDRAWLVPGVACAIACVGLLFGTIAGREIVEHLVMLGDAGRVTEFIQEWGPTRWSDPAHRLPMALIVVGALAGLALLRQHVLLAGAAMVGAYLGLQHVRGLTEGVLLALPMAAVGVSAAFERVRVAGMTLLARVGPVALVATVVLAHLTGTERPLAGIPGVGIDDRRLPTDGIEVIRALPPGRTMNNMDIGGYLIWERVPGGVFVDGRILALYTAAQFDELCVATMMSEEGLTAAADAYDVKYAVASHVSVMGRQLMRARSWIPVFHGRSSTVYARRSEERALRRAGFGMFDDLRFDLDTEWMDRWYGEVLSDAERTETLVRQVADGLTLSPPSPVALEVQRYLDARHPTVARRVEAAVARGPAP